MKKNVVQDVIPPKKSIRNIELDNRSKPVEIPKVKDALPKPEIKISKLVETEMVGMSPKETSSVARNTPISEQAPMKIEPSNTISEIKPPVPPKPPTPPVYKYEYDGPRKSPKKFLYISIFVVLLVAVFGISTIFKSATITVTPKQDSKTLNSNFTAKKDSVANELAFQVVTVSKDVEKAVTAVGEEKVEKKASGRVILYNNHSTAPQNLVATTRLETPEGLIFRLQNNVSIPGRTTVAGKTVAGSVEATVLADVAGANYNIDLKDFTIVGFKNDPAKYKDIFARSKTTMTGGFSGMQKKVSKEDLDRTDKELESSLRETLSKDITSQIPANFVLYKNTLSYKLDPSSAADSSTNGAIIKKKGTVDAVIIDKAMLTRQILAKIAPDLVNETLKISNLEDLNFAYATGTVSNLEVDKTISFKLDGGVNLIWVFDENKLKSDLLGLSKKSAMDIISSYTSIKEAWIETSPFWNQTIPENTDKVTLINTLTK